MNLEEKICAEIAKQVNSEEVEDYIKKAVRKMFENRVDSLIAYSSPIQGEVIERLKTAVAEVIEQPESKGQL